MKKYAHNTAKGRREQPARGQEAVCPHGTDVGARQRDLRRRAAMQASFIVAELSDRWSPGQYTVTNKTGIPRTYRTVYHGAGSEYNYCECMDFRTNCLGTCKHIEAVALWLENNSKEPVTTLPRRTALYMSYNGVRRLKLRLGADASAELMMAAMRYFDDDMTAVPGRVAELPAFIELARRYDPMFHCYPDALNYIIEERDRRRRMKLLDELTDADFDDLLATRLYPYQVDGIRFAFAAGRALIADERGLGKTVQAIGAAELMRRKNLIYSVLVLCPTSLKYQWKRQIERFTGAEVTIVEGPAEERRTLYRAETPYKIVSYHTWANDIRTLGTLQVDCLIMDEVQRLKNWDTQITQAARRVEADYAVVLSDTPFVRRPEELYTVMQFVDQYALGPHYAFVDRHVVLSEEGKADGFLHYDEIVRRLKDCMLRRTKADVKAQLPARADKTLLVPMTKEQRAVHDEYRQDVVRLLHKWQSIHFLSEKDRKRLLMLLNRMRMVCDSTFVVDQKSRFDTKPAEAVQIVCDMIDNGSDEKIVIFSQWERMARIMAEELDRARIAFEFLHDGIPATRRRSICEAYNRARAVRVLLTTDAGGRGLRVPGASLLINLDCPGKPALAEQRVSRVHLAGRPCNLQVINMIAADTIEERMAEDRIAGRNLFERIFDGGDADGITLDDSSLDRLVELFIRPFSADTPDPDQLVAGGIGFLSGLARTLASPEATERLADTIVHTDPDTGRCELRIPIADRTVVTDTLAVIAKILAAAKP